jgi:uncharacterized protein (TIGR00296 family)
MATIEHCLYCFEALASHFEDRDSMSLSEIQKLYPEYIKSLSADKSTTTKRHPALERLAASYPSGTASPASDSSASSLSSSSSSTPNPASSSATTPATSTSSLYSAAASSPVTETPLFVTWNILRHGHYQLRGCIGTFEPQELEDGLSSYAITSALHDSRFNPISERELPHLQVGVTLLTDFEEADHEMDWELGKHGIRISFVHHGRRFGATYLPDVAVEQEWTKEETLVSLMRKAGWMGNKSKWREVPLKVVRYQGKKSNCEYEEYKAFRDWVVQNGKA